MHCNLVRCETGFLNDRSFLFDSLSRAAGLEPNDAPIRSALYSGYALEQWCAFRKFGPNYVKFRTPPTNIRLTTFVCHQTAVTSPRSVNTQLSGKEPHKGKEALRRRALELLICLVRMKGLEPSRSFPH